MTHKMICFWAASHGCVDPLFFFILPEAMSYQLDRMPRLFSSRKPHPELHLLNISPAVVIP